MMTICKILFYIWKNKKTFTLVKNLHLGSCMRKILHEQLELGEIDISLVKIDLLSRDELPQLLLGFQQIYMNHGLFTKISSVLTHLIPSHIDCTTGRSGMHLWRIFVLGSLRLCCNWDYDKVQEIANNHHTLRQILGHSSLDFSTRYSRQSLCDNLRLFTVEILDEINQLVVDFGLEKFGKSPLTARCDSFVVETDVHFPTDINLLWDAISKVLLLTHRLSQATCIPGWRQSMHNLKVIKRLYRKVQNSRRHKKSADHCLHDTQVYIDRVYPFLVAAWNVARDFEHTPLHGKIAKEIMRFVCHGERQIDQIYRRCIRGETILHNEKVFSLFEEHTEWIIKGKTGVTQELGLAVSIVESAEGFILHHQVLQKQTDAECAVRITADTKKRYKQLHQCSYDKGFYSPDNHQDLKKILKQPILPQKGKANKQQIEFEKSVLFKTARRQHAAVESAIHALENHGLDRCPDKGVDGFKRYIGLAIVARNIQILGCKIMKQKKRALKKVA